MDTEFQALEHILTLFPDAVLGFSTKISDMSGKIRTPGNSVVGNITINKNNMSSKSCMRLAV